MQRTVLAALATLALSGCQRSSPSASGGGDAAPPPAQRGVPFVLAGPHAIEEGVWTPDGAVLARSDHELYMVSPEAPGSVSRIVLRRKLGHFAGHDGAPAFLTSDATGVLLWDARTRRIRHTLIEIPAADAGAANETEAPFVALSPRGDVAAVESCDGVKFDDHRVYQSPTCSWDLFDTESGTRVGRAPRVHRELAGEISFSADGAYLVLALAGTMMVAEARSGQEIARRTFGNLSEGGSILDLTEIVGTTWLTSRNHQLEAFDLQTKKVTFRVPLPADPASSFGIDQHALRVAIVSPQQRRLLVVSADRKHRTTSLALPGGTEARDLPAPRFEGERVVMGSLQLDLATGTFETRSDPTPTTHVAESTAWTLHELGTTPRRCEVLHRADGSSHQLSPMACARSPENGVHPHFRADDKLVAGIDGGALRIFDVATGADVAGIGPNVTAAIEQFRQLAVAEGRARLTIAAHPEEPLWLTQGPPPAVFDPPVPPGATAYRTASHVFVVHDTHTERTLVAYDKTGKEVHRETVEPFDASGTASGNAIVLRMRGCDSLYCEVGSACRPISLGGYLAGFEQPWAIIHPRAVCSDPPDTRLLDLKTGSARALPTCHGQLALVGPEPLFTCRDPETERVLRLDGSVVHERPASSGRPPARSGSTFPLVYTLDVTNFGLMPARRENLTSGERVELFLGNQFGIAQFSDGAIERFGNAEEANLFLFCAENDHLLPYAACSATTDVRGRF